MNVFVAEEKRLLWKKQMESIVANLERMYLSNLFDKVCREIEIGYHVRFNSEHGHLWCDISKDCYELYSVVQATSKVYVENLRMCAKGREKFACIQIQWMGMIMFVLHEHPAANSTVAIVQCVWESLIVTVNLHSSLEHSNALFSSMCTASIQLSPD